MSRAPRVLGDPHNFGRRVEKRAGWLHKPRTLVWERMLLSRQSPLRRALASAGEPSGQGRDAFEFLPSLEFGVLRGVHGGEVSEIALAPLGRLDDAERSMLAVVTGRLVALASWFGLADLHWENLALGRDAAGRLVFGPLDLEFILDDLELPTDTKLVPDAEEDVAAECRHAAGLRRVLPYLGKPIRPAALALLVGSYRTTLDLLEEHADALAAAIVTERDLEDAPIRVCLRGTAEYGRARTMPVWPPLLDAEAEQLARGDIPYFFRRLGKPGIRYFTSDDLASERALPSRGDVPKLEPLLSLERRLRSRRRQTLRDEGSLALVGALDHTGLDGAHEAGGVRLEVDARTIVVAFADGAELVAPRDLRSYVESLYLPCRCGEVRTVTATMGRCDASDSGTST